MWLIDINNFIQFCREWRAASISALENMQFHLKKLMSPSYDLHALVYKKILTHLICHPFKKIHFISELLFHTIHSVLVIWIYRIKSVTLYVHYWIFYRLWPLNSVLMVPKQLPENYSKHSFYLSLHLHRFGNGNFQRHVSKGELFNVQIHTIWQ